MDAIKKNENNLISLENGNDNGSSVISEEEVTSHEREVSQRPCNVVIDDPILISDSDDSSNHSNESNIQCISDDEEPPNTHAGESTSQIQLPKISSYGSIGKGYMRDFFIRNGFPVFAHQLTSVDLISDDDDE